MLLVVSPESVQIGGEMGAESGTNWMVERQIVPPEEAERAANEFFGLVEERRLQPLSRQKHLAIKRGCESFMEVQYRHDDEEHPKEISVYSFAIYVDANARTDGITNHPELAQKIPTLLHLFEKAKANIGKETTGFLVNIYPGGGVFNWHRDNYPSATTSIILDGSRELDIKNGEPGPQQPNEISLATGDGFVIWNTENQDGRPEHRLRNPSKRRSMSLVV